MVGAVAAARGASDAAGPRVLSGTDGGSAATGGGAGWNDDGTSTASLGGVANAPVSDTGNGDVVSNRGLVSVPDASTDGGGGVSGEVSTAAAEGASDAAPVTSNDLCTGFSGQHALVDSCVSVLGATSGGSVGDASQPEGWVLQTPRRNAVDDLPCVAGERTTVSVVGTPAVTDDGAAVTDLDETAATAPLPLAATLYAASRRSSSAGNVGPDDAASPFRLAVMPGEASVPFAASGTSSSGTEASLRLLQAARSQSSGIATPSVRTRIRFP